MATPLQITLLLVFILILLDIFMRNRVSRKLSRLLQMQDYEGVLEYTTHFAARFFTHPFPLAMVRLDAYVALDRNKEAIELIRQIQTSKHLGKRQRDIANQRAFELYLDTGAYKRAGKMLDAIEASDAKQTAQHDRMMYNIIARKSSEYLERMLKELPKAKGMERAELLSLISLQYQNRGNKAKAKHYTEELEKMRQV